MRSRDRRPTLRAAACLVALAGVTACTAGNPSPGVSSAAVPTPVTTTAGPIATPVPATPSATPVAVRGEIGDVRELATGLDVPWGLAFLPDGRALVTQRGTGSIVAVDARGAGPATVSALGGPGAATIRAATAAQGEGGLLGIAVRPDADGTVHVFVYVTTERDNEVLSARLDGASLGETTVVLAGIPKGSNHDGGRLAFGPDGYLYVTTGETGNRALAQDPASLGGKILRITTDGAPAPGNPTAGSPVWSLGHRNVQGIGWAADGRMFASEFGQDTWDELNVIVPGGNYGWPVVEGDPGSAADGFVRPVATWATHDASPSGLAVTSEGVYLAALRGERLWRVPLLPGTVGAPLPLLVGAYGRLRNVTVAPDGSLWVLTGNTDGRGTVRAGDDRLLRVTIV
ncbi:glucose sorbosone dehydrogenase [Cellulomonas sp. WB94]|uniref:PQQ-dependent sugar dehydrogenase n=1 Tax=Cellulomonas sp. WB94 TaxID=2173174 RepID=UPI000D5635BF|nr:PQQ-dependent sugar dehydrogenase [Cellulomonas sp. WB94]PVU83484.1 glucose sorbosone dehydrogenase [Cellulomonas sp. WB94]